jgi:hypothetical protein
MPSRKATYHGAGAKHLVSRLRPESAKIPPEHLRGTRVGLHESRTTNLPRRRVSERDCVTGDEIERALEPTAATPIADPSGLVETSLLVGR